MNIQNRLKEHRRRLRRGNHENEYLQNSWNKYGEENFVFEAIEMCKQESLLSRENLWMNHYASYLRKNGFNIINPSNNIASYPRSDDHNKRLSEARKVHSDDELISHLHEVYYMTGLIPNYKTINVGMPNNFHQIYRRRFGSLKEAIIISGILTPHIANDYLKEEVSLDELMDAFNAFISIHGRFPKQKERILKNNLYSASVILKHFKGMKEFRDALNFTEEDERKLKSEVELNILKDIYKEYGYISTSLIDSLKRTRYSKQIVAEYGSTHSLYRAIGVDFKRNEDHFNMLKSVNKMKKKSLEYTTS